MLLKASGMTRASHVFCAIIIQLLMLAAASAQQVARETWQFGPTTPAAFNQRIEDAAIEYYDDAPIPRVIFYDIAFPADADEYASLDGHAVVLLSAFSQERDELPLKRVYVLWDGKEIELKLIKSWSQAVSARGIIGQTFGTNRTDAIYLLPVYLRLKSATLMADFAKNRKGLQFAEFNAGVPERVSRLPIKEPTGKGFSAAALMQFISREYPGILKKQ